MAALSSRSAAQLSQNLRKLRLTKVLKVNHVCGALFHGSSTLNVEGLPIKMPSLSPTMMEGTIVKWLKQEGDSIAPGDIICDIQTDKAVVAMEMDEEGTLAKILVPEDTKDIKVGTLIAVLAPEGEDWKSVEIPSVDVAAGAPAVAPSAPAAPPAPASTPSAAAALPAVAAASHGNYGPSVRLLLEKFGLDEEQVPPSGPHGKLLKGDVLRLVKEKNIQPIAVAPAPPPEAPKAAAAAPAPAAPQAPKPQPAPIVKPGDGYQDIEVSNMRRTIAKRLMQSKGGIAHSYGTIDCSVDKLVSLRKQFKEDGVNVSMNDLIIKAVAVALHQCPEMNSIWQGNQLIQSESVDISVAVATDAGLITPIVHNADMLGIQEIAAKVRDLASRARENKLKLEEFQGGSFTISNLGMFGISEFSAIINPPQCGILAVGGGRLTVDESGSLSTRMNATLSYDRLGVDDDSAAVFLSILKDLLEEPKTLMLGALPIAQLARGLL